MKKLFIALVMIAGCAGSSEKHIQLVEQWIQQNANDPKSYEPGNFSKVDTLIIDFKNTDAGYEQYQSIVPIQDQLENVNRSLNVERELLGTVLSNKKMVSLLTDSVAFYQAKVDSAAKKYVEAEKEYMKSPKYRLFCTHDFRAKNAMGAIIKQSYYFEFNDSLTKIIEAKPM